MPTLQLSAVGTAPVELAWERYADPTRWASWSPQIRAVVTAATRIAPGVTGTVHGPLGVRVRFEVLEVDEVARRWRWRVGFGPVGVELEHAVAPLGDRTRSTLALEGPPSVLPLLLGYAPLARLALGRLVAP